MISKFLSPSACRVICKLAAAHAPVSRVLQVKSLAESTGDVESATPSLAVQMVGLNSVPTAGDEFYVCEDEAMARKAAEVAEDAQVRVQHACCVAHAQSRECTSLSSDRILHVNAEGTV